MEDAARALPRCLVIPTHPGVQYHFCRAGLPVSFLGHWDQFRYWRPQPPNVRNLLPRFEEEQLEWGPGDFARLLDEGTYVQRGRDYDVAWLMFNWQYKLFAGRPGKKLYRVAKTYELDDAEWRDLLGNEDSRVVSFYPNTVEALRARYGVEVPYVPLGLDPALYQGWTGEGPGLSIIHSWKERGWNYRTYVEGTEGLGHVHVDHLDASKEVQDYDGVLSHLRRARYYLHDGEQEYTITLLEALMTGLPVVSFELPGIERYVLHGVNGFVVRTAAQLRESCRLLLADRELAASMGAQSRALALRDYAEDRWRAQWQTLLSDFVR